MWYDCRWRHKELQSVRLVSEFLNLSNIYHFVQTVDHAHTGSLLVTKTIKLQVMLKKYKDYICTNYTPKMSGKAFTTIPQLKPNFLLSSLSCWLTESAGLGAFVGPACLVFIVNAVLLVRLHLLLARGIIDQHPSTENTENPEEERLETDEPGVLEEAPDPCERPNAEKSAITLYLVATWVVMSLIYLNFILAYFLLNSRTSKFRWAFLSYIYALANIALGASIFGFHCVARPEVRKAWRVTWKVLRAWKINCGPCRTLWITRRKNEDTTQINGRILVNGEDVTHRIESDRQSNITLPSSAALTNDVFVNGRPLSTARVSLLDEADFPPEGSPLAGAVDNQVKVKKYLLYRLKRRGIFVQYFVINYLFFA